jgi:acetyltransferase
MSVNVLSHGPGAPAAPAQHSLDVLFAPESVAIFGATEAEASMGRTLTFNLLRHPFGGVLFPISPHRSSVLGVRAYPHLAAVPRPVDLAIVVTPAPTVPDILAQCLAANVRAAIVLSDSGPASADLECRVQEIVRAGSMRVLGLGSFGVACPRTGFSATCTRDMLLPGSVGFLTQSGALLTALLNHAYSEHVGCSVAVSVGSLIDIGWTEWLDYLAEDPHTRCIAVYMEQFKEIPGGARSFFAAAREVAGRKPILLIKSGRANALGSEDQVFDEACRSSGVLRVHSFDDLFRLAAHLTAHPVPRGKRLTILSNARGLGVLAADALCLEGGCLARLAPETITALSAVLTTRWNQQNPIDAGSDSTAARFLRAATLAANDPSTDALLVLLAPQASIDPMATAEGLRPAAESGKPVLACWMWEAANQESLAALSAAGIPTFRSPESAVRTFGYLWRHSENLRFLSEIREALHDSESSEPVPGGWR